MWSLYLILFSREIRFLKMVLDSEPVLQQSLNSKLLSKDPCPRHRLRAAPSLLFGNCLCTEPCPGRPIETYSMEMTMFNNTQFRIIGRIGSVNSLNKVVHISIASDRRTKNDSGEWITKTSWNSVTIFSTSLRKRLEQSATARHGNLITVEGTIQSSAYDKDGQKLHQTTLVVDELEVLHFAKKNEC